MTIKDQETIEAIHNLFHEVVEFVQVAFDDVKQSPERSFEHYQKIMKLPICQSDTEFPEWVNVPPPFIPFLGSIYKDSLQAMIQFIEPVLTWTTGLREKHKNLKKWQLETKKLLKRAFFSKMALHDFMREVGTLEQHFLYERGLYRERLNIRNKELAEKSQRFVDDFIQRRSGQRQAGAKIKDALEWSRAMSKNRMMTALGIRDYDTFNSFAARHGLKMYNKSLWQICLDNLSQKEKEKLEKA